MKNTATLRVTTPTDREIVMTRVFDAPRRLVFDAFTKCELLKRWLFGPDGWYLVVCEVDLRVGGKYRYVWRHPEKKEMGMGGVYREVVPPERVVNTEVFDDWPGESLVTMVLAERGGKTTVTTTMLYPSQEVRDAVLKSGMATGVGTSYDRLTDLLTSLQEIHRSLVPPVATSTSQHEIYGVSVPSGEMGGDLVDLVQNANKWIGYVADVSGHGVPSGILMAMVKSATRMRLVTRPESPMFLQDLNRVMSDLKAEDMFVTLAYVALGSLNDLYFATAGHLPILHFHSATGSVCELSTSNPPVGTFKDQEFTSSRVQFSSGDIAILLTDGLTEATNQQEEEYGLERVKQQVTKHSTEPLKVICETLLAEARRFGKQMDDQSVLLVRRL